MRPETWSTILSVLLTTVRAANRNPQIPVLLDMARDIGRAVDQILNRREMGLYVLSSALESTTLAYKEISALIKDEGHGLAATSNAQRSSSLAGEAFSALEGLLFSHMACVDHWQQTSSSATTASSSEGSFIDNCGLLAGPKSRYYKELYKFAYSMALQQIKAKNV